MKEGEYYHSKRFLSSISVPKATRVIFMNLKCRNADPMLVTGQQIAHFLYIALMKE